MKIEAVVEKEIATYLKNMASYHPKIAAECSDKTKLLTYFLNNMHLNYLVVENSRRRNMRSLGITDETVGSQVSGNQSRLTSSHCKGKTYQQMFQDFDAALVKSGGDIKEVRRLFSEDMTANRMRITEILFPAYLELRRMGYNHGDITR